MHRFGAWLTALLLSTLTGCFTSESARPSSWLDRVRTANRTLAPDGVLLDIVVIERPLGDAFVNRGLWACTDEQVVGIERKALLADNGFRVGHVVGALLAELQNLLTSGRHCALCWRQMLASGDQKSVPLGPALPDAAARCARTARRRRWSSVRRSRSWCWRRP